MILRLVSMRHCIPFSMREIVIGETFAFLESSALLIIKDSLIFFTRFLLMINQGMRFWVLDMLKECEKIKMI